MFQTLHTSDFVLLPRMSSTSTVINGLVSALAFKYVNTGDKLLDTAYTGVITYFTALLITYLTNDGYYILYNYLLYNLKYRDTPYEKIDYTRFYHIPGRVDRKYQTEMIYHGQGWGYFTHTLLPQLNMYYSMYDAKTEKVKLTYIENLSHVQCPSAYPVFITKKGNIVYLEQKLIASRDEVSSYTLYSLNSEDVYTALAHIKNDCMTITTEEASGNNIVEYEVGTGGSR